MVSHGIRQLEPDPEKGNVVLHDDTEVTAMSSTWQTSGAPS